MGWGQDKACDTTGTNTDAGYAEHAFNFDVAARVRTILRAHGVRVLMTRHQRPRGRAVRRPARRGQQHPWGAGGGGHPRRRRVPRPARASTSTRTAGCRTGRPRPTLSASYALGRAEHAALLRYSGLVPSTYVGTHGYVYRSDFATLNLSHVPTTFLELGNMRNAHDAALQSSARGREQIARAVAYGVIDYLAHHP